MNSLIVLGLVAVILVAVGHMLTPQARPPQIIYIQTTPAEAGGGAGCLPLLILARVVLLAIALG